MAKGDYLGEFEYIIMLSLIRLKDDAYGMTIRQDIESQTDRPVALGAVYASLERLENKNYIRSREAATTRGRGSRSKRYYSISGLGMEAVRRTRETFRRMEEGTQPAFGRVYQPEAA